MPGELFYINSLDRSFLYDKFLLLSCFVEISELNANSVDPDQGPRSAASDLGLHCLPCAFYGTPGFNGLTITSLHYENTPIQIYRKFHLQKLNIFR